MTDKHYKRMQRIHRVVTAAARKQNLEELVSRVLETPEEAMHAFAHFRELDKKDPRFKKLDEYIKNGSTESYRRYLKDDEKRWDAWSYRNFSKAVFRLFNPKPTAQISREEGRRILHYLSDRKGTRDYERLEFIDAKVRYYTQLKKPGLTYGNNPTMDEVRRDPSINERFFNEPRFDHLGGSELTRRDFTNLVRAARKQLPRLYKIMRKVDKREHPSQEYQAFMGCGNYLLRRRILTEPEYNALTKLEARVAEINDRNHKRKYGRP